MDILDKALKEGRETLSEYESKIVLASYHIPVTREIIIQKDDDIISAAHEIGY
ncbi:MAG: carboxylate--amine ligase, partial [Deltaproteobacteria bacterium]